MAFRQSIDDASAIRQVAVLTHLPLAIEPRNRHPQTDNSSELRFDEIGRGVRHRPAILSWQFWNVSLSYSHLQLWVGRMY